MFKGNLIFFTALTFLIGTFAQCDAIAQTQFNRSRLSNIIDSLEEQDQKWRHLWTMDPAHETTGSLTKEEILFQLRQTDSLNFFALKEIVAQIGYPDVDDVGPTSSKNFWLLVQHQDKHPEFQEGILKLMKIDVDRGKVSLEDYAYLLDRVLVNTGQLQVYGTQMMLDSAKTTFKPKPVKDINHLDDRRKSVGLPSIEIYIQQMNEHYHGFLTGVK